MGSSIRTRVLCAALAGMGVLGGGLARAGDRPMSPKPPPAKPPAKPPEPAAPPVLQPGRVLVTFPAGDGVVLSAIYASQNAGKGAPAVVLVHGEGQTRAAFRALFDALDE